MMMAGMALLMACQPNAAGTEEKHEHEHSTQEEGMHKHEKHIEKTHVSLNNGKRWEANIETNEGIFNMLYLIDNFNAQDQTYEALQADLQNEFRTIFKKCTMTGEAHNQLHNYLIPLKEKIEQVSAENLNDIRDYLNTYKDYFK